MLGIAVLICSGIVIGRVAEAEDRSEWLWGLGTVVASVAISHFIGYGFIISGPLAVVALFTLMFAMNVVNG